MQAGWQFGQGAGVRFLVALFVAATVLVSSCAAACFGAQFTAASAAESGGHCDHPREPAGKENSSSDCSTHGHPTAYVKDRTSIKLDPLAVTDLVVGIPQVAASVPEGESAVPEGRDHAPFVSTGPLYERDCSLRI